MKSAVFCALVFSFVAAVSAAPSSVPSGKAVPAQKAAQEQPVKAPAALPAQTDFDALNAVNDPLYLQGTKELLKQAVKQDEAAGKAVKSDLRDAPNSKPSLKAAPEAKPAPDQFKKNRVRKPLEGDALRNNII
jgi:hypothetical protein